MGLERVALGVGWGQNGMGLERDGARAGWGQSRTGLEWDGAGGEQDGIGAGRGRPHNHIPDPAGARCWLLSL